MTSEFKKGDTVKVTLEGTVVNIVPYGDDRIELRIEDTKNGDVYYISPDKGNVEKVEPPVEVFGPGTIVRDKREGSVWAVGSRGYLRLDGAYGPVKSDMVVTSEDYELHEFQVQ